MILPKKVVLKAIQTALIVGTILTFINQWQGIFGNAPFHWVPFGLTYLVPFLVFIYSYFHNKKHHEK